MHPELETLIYEFRDRQDLAVDFLHRSLGIPIPTTTFKWVQYCRDHSQTLAEFCNQEGVKLIPHGYGIEVIHPDFQIDFDYGPGGEIDCFDVWRLAFFRHMSHHRPNPIGPYDDISRWIEEAVRARELIVVPETTESIFRHPRRLRFHGDFDKIMRSNHP